MMVGGISAISSLFERSNGVSSVQGAATGMVSGLAGAASPQPVTSTGAASFADMLTQVGASTIDSVKQSEAASIAHMKGELGTRETVNSLLTAERSVQIAIAIREKMLSSYQEVTRMTI